MINVKQLQESLYSIDRNKTLMLSAKNEYHKSLIINNDFAKYMQIISHVKTHPFTFEMTVCKSFC